MAWGSLFFAGLFAWESLKTFLEPIKEVLYDETLTGGLRLVKWEFWKHILGLKMFYGTFDDMTEAEPNLVTGYAPAGLTNIFDYLIRASLTLSMFMGEEMAEEILLELLQEGISNSIQTSIGGAFQTILNVYRGSQPVYGDDVSNIPLYWDNVDDKINVFNIASSGMNFLGSLHYLLQGVHTRADDEFREIYHTLTSLTTRAIEEELWWLLTYMELARNNILQRLRDAMDISQRYAEIVIGLLQDAIGRCNDMIQDIETEISRLESGTTTEDNAKLVKDSVVNDFDALKKSVDEAYLGLLSLIDKVTHTLDTTDFDLYEDALNRYRTAIRNIINEANRIYISWLNEQYSKVYKLLDMMLCYRFYSDTHQYSPEEVEATKVLSLVEGTITAPEVVQLTVQVYEEEETSG